MARWWLVTGKQASDQSSSRAPSAGDCIPTPGLVPRGLTPHPSGAGHVTRRLAECATATKIERTHTNLASRSTSLNSHASFSPSSNFCRARTSVRVQLFNCFMKTYSIHTWPILLKFKVFGHHCFRIDDRVRLYGSLLYNSYLLQSQSKGDSTWGFILQYLFDSGHQILIVSKLKQ